MKRHKVAVADIGATHARFAIAIIENGSVASIGDAAVLTTGGFESLDSAWAEVERRLGPLPRAASIAVAAPVLGERAPMTNGRWVLNLPAIRSSLELETLTVLNDFGAVAHAVANLSADQFIHIAGPEAALPRQGTITVLGPGTGLGVAHLHRFEGGYHVQATEGGHIGFAPQDEFDDRMLSDLRAKHGRVVTEQIHAGPGILHIYAALGGTELADEREIWSRGIQRNDPLAAQTVDRFCASLGTVAGDYALAHGSSAVVLAGGVGLRLRELLPQSQFGERFRAKPRYEEMMAAIPVKLIIHPQPGLYGAAAAFAQEYRWRE